MRAKPDVPYEGSSLDLRGRKLILEIAVLNVRSGEQAAFEAAFALASPIIAGMKGHLSHELQRCMEHEGKYVLLVRWHTLEDHTIGFRTSPEYQKWKAILHHFYHPFPTVEHYEQVCASAG